MYRPLHSSKFISVSFVLFCIVLICLASCQSNPESHDTITFMAGYKPQANLPFVAAYVAQENKYFEQQGLRVDLRHSSGQHTKLLMSGEVQVTTLDASALLKFATTPGLPIMAVALFGHKGQQAFASLKVSQIKSPSDWEGKVFGYKISLPPEYLGIIDVAGVNRSEIKEVQVGFDPRILIEGNVDILAIFKSNEPDILNRMGFETSVIDPSDFGIPTLGLTYVTTTEFVKQQPELVKRFLKATMKGLNYAIENPEATLAIIEKYAPKEDKDHMRFMMMTEIADATSATSESLGYGSMTHDQWDRLHNFLLLHGAIPHNIDVAEVYEDKFITEIYQRGVLIWP